MDSTERFSSRVENYRLARPGYPKILINFLQENCHLTSDTIVADIGSGTGIFTKLLLKNGLAVYGVEPNKAMRLAAETYLSDYASFKSIGGQADNTHLPDHSIDLITAAQAFHWFNNQQTEKEFSRILKPNGSIFLVWNLRENNTPFMKDYEQLLRDYGTDYLNVCPEQRSKQQFKFKGRDFKTASIDNIINTNWQQLKSRLLSCSYIPSQGAPNYQAMMQQLEDIFNKNQRHGIVQFTYITKCYYLNL